MYTISDFLKLVCTNLDFWVWILSWLLFIKFENVDKCEFVQPPNPLLTHKNTPQDHSLIRHHPYLMNAVFGQFPRFINVYRL